jgi:DNA-binding MarR family transcriptional regulator
MTVNDHCRHIDRLLKKLQLNCRKYSILCNIETPDEPPRTQRDLAKKAAIKENRLVGILHDMSKQGLLRRNKEGDRRPNVVSITPRGRKSLEKASTQISAYYDEMFSKMREEEKKAAVCLLKAYS